MERHKPQNRGGPLPGVKGFTPIASGKLRSAIPGQILPSLDPESFMTKKKSSSKPNPDDMNSPDSPPSGKLKMVKSSDKQKAADKMLGSAMEDF